MQAMARVLVLLAASLGAATPTPRPQDDLFAHVNQAWLQATTIPDDRVTQSAVGDLADRIEEQLHGIITELQTTSPRRGTDAQRIVDLYQSVVDTEAVERLGLEPARADLEKILAVDGPRRAAEVAGYLASIAAGGLFESTVSSSGREPRLSVTIRPGGLLLPEPTFYLNPSLEMRVIRREYAAYLTHMYQLAGMPPDEADSQAGAVLRLETRLAQVMLQRTGPERQIHRVSDLPRVYPGFDWASWARPQGMEGRRTLTLVQPAFFAGFASIIADTPAITVRYWLLGRYLTATAPFLPRRFSDARFAFFGTRLMGQVTPRPEWKRGVSMVSEFLGDAIGREYVQRYMDPATPVAVDAIVTQILAVAREAVDDADWLSPAQRRLAARSVEGITARIGAPPRWRGYGGVTIRADERLGNLRRLQRFDVQDQLRRVQEAGNGREWLVTAHSVNAFYSSLPRAVTVPAGILQPPFFDPGGDAASNYGAIGAVIGHEVGHALDAFGASARAAGLRAHYATFDAVPGMRVNGHVTFSENVADLIGLQFAHRAYRRSLNGDEAPVLDGLTGDQRFFLSWARIWRGQSRPDYVRYANSTSPHAPPHVRANGPAMHLDAFHDAFNVVPGDRMYLPPSERIRVW